MNLRGRATPQAMFAARWLCHPSDLVCSAVAGVLGQKNDIARMANKLRIINQLQFGRVAFRFHFGETRKPFLLMVSGFLEVSIGPKTNYLNASSLPPAPLAVVGFLVTGLVAWQSSDRLAGLLGVGCLFSCFAGSL